jgi:hypothetical protein
MASLAYIRSRKLIELLHSADPAGEMYVTIAGTDRLAVGVDPLSPTTDIDFFQEAVRANSQRSLEGRPISTSDEHGTDQIRQMPFAASAQRRGRNLGAHWYALNGNRTECRSVKELLIDGLRSIEAEYPGTLDKLSRLKKRTKRIVARERNDLFDQKHLIADHSEQLMRGWWVGTNNSSSETEAWLKQAVSCAGLIWGKEFQTSL